jgi:acyl-CoA reductase-like NAD-dependent aldehyde dehydrogenase
VAGLVRFSTEEEAIALANDTDAGLAAYVYTTISTAPGACPRRCTMAWWG